MQRVLQMLPLIMPVLNRRHAAKLLGLSLFLFFTFPVYSQGEKEPQEAYGGQQQKVVEQASVIGGNSIVLEKLDDPDLQNDQAQNDAEKPCVFNHPGEQWIDGVRRSTHGGLCRSALWLDGLFGDKHEFNDEDFRGKLSIGFRHDEADGFDPRLRVRIKTRLPNVSRKFNAFIGRVEEDSFVSNTEDDQNRVTAVGLKSNDNDEAEWLVGLGYRNPKSRIKGFDYSIGAKLSHGLSPYAKVTHRYMFTQSAAKYWRTEQTLFWRRDERFGVSSKLDYTHLIGDRDILEWDGRIKYTEADEQWEWVTGSTWHHSFDKTKGVSSRIYVRGEEKNPVSIPEYGLTFTYVRPFLRPWLFVETGVDFRWEKEFEEDRYESSIRYGIRFEMLLGDYYSRDKEYDD